MINNNKHFKIYQKLKKDLFLKNGKIIKIQKIKKDKVLSKNRIIKITLNLNKLALRIYKINSYLN